MDNVGNYTEMNCVCVCVFECIYVCESQQTDI